MFRGSVLLFAILISSPALWSSFVDGSMSLYTGLVRFLIAVPIAALMLMIFRAVTASYHRAERARRRQDQLDKLTAK